MTTDQETPCGCVACTVTRIFPAAGEHEDRIPVIVGIDVSTKFIAFGIVPAMGEMNDVGGFGFIVESKKDTHRCQEVSDKSLLTIIQMHEAFDITSIAIENPRGFGGKLIPIVGAITGALSGGNVEWYGPTTWQSIIKKEYDVSREDVKDKGTKAAIHEAVAATLPQGDRWLELNEDMRDAVCIALAHRIEMLQSSSLTDADLEWLKKAADE